MKRVLIPVVAALAMATGVCVGVAQQSNRVFLIATATVEPGQLAEYMGIVEEQVLPFMSDQGAEVIGVFRNGIGGPSNELHIMIAYRDLAHVQTVAETSTLTDLQAQTFANMRVLNQQVLNPVSFSPLR